MADLPINSSDAQPVNITDPTVQTQAANVKAASTAAVAADNSLVVALSPNSPVPTGSNNIGVTGVAQGSTTSGEHGDLVQGAVTTAAPTYVTAQTSPLSLTTAGSLRTDLEQIAGSSVATAATGIMKVGLTDGSGNALTSTASNGDQALDISTSLSADGLAAFDNTVFTTSFSFNLPTSGTESNAIYLKNPNGSGKTLVIKRIHVAPITSTNALATVRIYSDPTTSANGTSQSATTTSIGSGATAVATPFSGPTSSANGAQLYAFTSTSAADGGINNPINMDGIIRVAANHNLLITGNPTTNNFNLTWTIMWQEV